MILRLLAQYNPTKPFDEQHDCVSYFFSTENPFYDDNAEQTDEECQRVIRGVLDNCPFFDDVQVIKEMLESWLVDGF